MMLVTYLCEALMNLCGTFPELLEENRTKITDQKRRNLISFRMRHASRDGGHDWPALKQDHGSRTSRPAQHLHLHDAEAVFHSLRRRSALTKCFDLPWDFKWRPRSLGAQNAYYEYGNGQNCTMKLLNEFRSIGVQLVVRARQH